MQDPSQEKSFQNDMIAQMLAKGWAQGSGKDYQRDTALYTSDALHFVKTTQPKEWDKLSKVFPSDTERHFLAALVAQLQKADVNATDRASRTYGTLGVLRHGLKIRNARFSLCPFKPEHSLNPETLARYEQNICRVVPELVYSPDATQAELEKTGQQAKKWRIIEEKEDWEGRKTRKETLIFPRYHQWDVVTKLVNAALLEGSGQKYLIQHGAGSGKSNSTAWTAHQLSTLYDDLGEKQFHSVIVVTDRTVLDDQLQDTIYQFEHADGVVGRINHKEGDGSKSEKLAAALEASQPIIIVTIQTFPHVLKAIENSTSLKTRRYAIIADEAHSSQTGATARQLKEVLMLEATDEDADQAVDAGRAKVKLNHWVRLHDHNISQKVKVIIEHFKKNVLGLLGGQAKAMVVTSSRKEAVRYKLAFDKYVAEQGYAGIQAMVAFLGEVEFNASDPDSSAWLGQTFNEHTMNPNLKGREMRKAFDSDDYQVMLVANKFQTGFDQPKLCAMYVDKKLAGVECVQTLSRLNRTYPGKAESGTFVLDFYNEPPAILDAFQPYYQVAKLEDVSDPDKIFDLFEKLRASGIFLWTEVEQFKDKKEAFLSEIIQRLNELFTTDKLTDSDRLNYAFTVRDKLSENQAVMQQIMHNTREQALLGDAILDSSTAHQEQMLQLLADPHKTRQFARVIFDMLLGGRG